MTALNQMELKLKPTPLREPQEVPLTVIAKQPTRTAALNLCVQASGLTADQICLEMDIDNAQWSRIMKGKAHFPTNRYHELYDICGNHIVLIWDMLQEGLDPESVRPLKSDLEKQLEDRAEEIDELKTRIKYFEEFMSMKG